MPWWECPDGSLEKAWRHVSTMMACGAEGTSIARDEGVPRDVETQGLLGPLARVVHADPGRETIAIGSADRVPR